MSAIRKSNEMVLVIKSNTLYTGELSKTSNIIKFLLYNKIKQWVKSSVQLLPVQKKCLGGYVPDA